MWSGWRATGSAGARCASSGRARGRMMSLWIDGFVEAAWRTQRAPAPERISPAPPTPTEPPQDDPWDEPDDDPGPTLDEIDPDTLAPDELLCPDDMLGRDGEEVELLDPDEGCLRDDDDDNLGSGMAGLFGYSIKEL